MLASIALWSPARVAAQEAAPAVKPPAIRSLAFSPDGKQIAAAADSNGAGILAIWNVLEPKPRLVKRDPVAMMSVAFAPGGKTLAIGVNAAEARLLDSESGEVLKTFKGHAGPVRSVAFSKEGRQLLTASLDRTVKIWDIADASCYATLEGHADAVTSAAFSPDGETVVSCGNDQTTRVWDAQTGRQKHLIKPTTFVVRTVAFSPDGRFFATAHYDGAVRIRETESTKLRARIKTGADWAVFSSDGRTLAVCSSDPVVNLFDIALAEPPADLRKKIADLITRWDDDDYAVREAASAELVKTGMVAELQLSEAMESESAEVRIRARRAHAEVWSPQPRTRLTGHGANVNCLAFSPVGKRLATGDEAGAIKIWDADSGKEIATKVLTESANDE